MENVIFNVNNTLLLLFLFYFIHFQIISHFKKYFVLNYVILEMKILFIQKILLIIILSKYYKKNQIKINFKSKK